MPTVKLTKTAIEGIEAPDPSGRQAIYWDTVERGFGVLVSGTTKAKTFIAQRRLRGGRSYPPADGGRRARLRQGRGRAAQGAPLARRAGAGPGPDGRAAEGQGRAATGKCRK